MLFCFIILVTFQKIWCFQELEYKWPIVGLSGIILVIKEELFVLIMFMYKIYKLHMDLRMSAFVKDKLTLVKDNYTAQNMKHF